MHLYEFTPSIQVALFMQGLLRHSSVSEESNGIDKAIYINESYNNCLRFVLHLYVAFESLYADEIVKKIFLLKLVIFEVS